MLALLGLPNVVLAAIVTAVVSVAFFGRVFGASERTETTWLDAWLKAGVILVFITFFGVYVPSWVLQTGTVAGLDRDVQQLVGSAVWAVALVVTIGGLAAFHRQKRV